MDRSFLCGINKGSNNSCIIKAIVAMARELKLGVIVEGVETEQQLEYVKSIGCNIVQGFLLGRPLPKNEIQALLK